MDYKTENLAPGIWLYKQILPDNLNIPEMLEEALSIKTSYRKWNPAKVGDNVEDFNHRKCVDFKIGKLDTWPINSKNKDLAEIYNSVNNAIHECKNHYEPMYGIYNSWQQVINFVRYGEGEFFSTHADTGETFSCTLSSVLYLNDNYEGGELWFEEFNLKVKPEKGDHFLFPSNYIYRHMAMPVTNGIKYSAVTMFDHTDRFHTLENLTRKRDY